jgi:hypothetical protein
MGEVLDAIKSEDYKLGDLQILRYDSKRPDVFPEGYLTKLYQLAKKSSRRSPLGILPSLFCGMTNLDHDSVTFYLATRPALLILAQWTSPSTFVPAGFAFPTTSAGIGEEKMIFAGFGYFINFWGRPEVLTLTILCLAYFLREFGLLAIHGSRYASNDKSARLMGQVGFRDVGRIPRYMLRDGKLVDMIASSLLVEDFEEKAFTLLEGIVGDDEKGRVAISEKVPQILAPRLPSAQDSRRMPMP